MSINILMSKNWAFIVIALFIFGGFTPSISGYNNKTDYFESVNVQDETTLKCYALGRYGVEETETTLSFEEAERIYNKLKELQVEMNLDPFSEKTHEAKVEYIDLLAEKNLIHHSLTKNDYLSLLTPQWHNQWKKIPINDLPRNGGIASSFVCSVTSGGMGTLLPPFLLPRPRMGLSWIGRGVYDAAATAVGSLLLARGFMAIGEQTGIALGFTGVGLTYGSPVGPIYGLAGYALFVTVNAEYIETFPPNFPPEISDESPRTGSSNIPVSLSELSFRINDPNGDRMSYTVTTDPYIGSGSGNMKGNGVYTVPVSNLQGSTEYTWYVSVSDGQDTTEKTFSFTTVFEAPIISNPSPSDGSDNVQVDISHLSFTLSDPQGDLMDVTVETQPDIGSYSDSNVNQGTFNIPVSGLDYFTDYTWYVNVTDGVHWKREIFTFTTLPKGIIVLYPTDDSYVSSRIPSQIAGDCKDLAIKNGGSGNNWAAQPVIKFDISSKTDIKSATLNIFYRDYHDNNPSGRELTIYRLKGDWNEDTITWDNMPVHHNEVTSSIYAPNSPSNWMQWDVTSDAQDFITGQTENYGWIIKDEQYWGGTGIPGMYCNSKEYGENIPYLEIGIAE